MKRTYTYIRKTLSNKYSHQEIESLIDIIFNHIYNYSKKDLIVNSDKILTEIEFDAIKKVVHRLSEKEPIQYIFGETEFYELPFRVSSDVLIPRGETEELVHLILKNHQNKTLKILDIGTGSGCIPISLKKNNPSFSTFACDISRGALKVATQNAEMNNAQINFIHFDILSSDDFPEKDFDIIISNPPYVTEKEKQLMDANVLDNEPHLALFVPNADPLKFYRAITNRAKSILKPSGEIYFEINEAYGQETVDLLGNNRFSATLIKDLNGKDRIVHGVKKT